MNKKSQLAPLAFDEFQMDRLIYFVEDVENHIGFRNFDGEAIRVNPNFSNHWVHGFEEYLPFINEALSHDLSKIKFLNQLIEEFNTLNVYPLDKGKEAIVSSLERLSKKYGFKEVPLIYTTASSPQKEHFPSWVWNELPNTERLKDDFGHVDFINAVLALEKEKILKIKKVAILTLDHFSFTVQVVVDYLKHATEKKILLFISKPYGIYMGDAKDKRRYPIKGKRLAIVRHLKDKNNGVDGKLLAASQKRPLSIVIKEIGVINETFQRKIHVKENLITHIPTGGYRLNENFNIKFLDKIP